MTWQQLSSGRKEPKLPKEAFTVFYNIEPTQNNPVNYKEKDIVTKAGEKNSGLFATNQTESILTGSAGTNQLAPTISKQLNKAEPLLSNAPQMATFVTLEAESGEEAAEAVRLYYGGYGSSIVSAKFLACKSGELKEVSAQP